MEGVLPAILIRSNSIKRQPPLTPPWEGGEPNMKKRNFLKSHQASIYKRSQYENPLFAHKKQKSSWKKYLAIPVAIFVLILIAWGLIVIPWLRINTINVEGLVTIYPDSIEQSAWNFIDNPVLGVLPGEHVWFVRLEKLQEALKDEFQLKTTEVSRDSRTINIEASERITRAVWVTNDQMYFLDSDGLVIRELSELERAEVEQQINTQIAPSQSLQSTVFTIWDLDNHAVELETQIVSPILLSTVEEFDQLLRDTTIQPISYIIDNKDEVWLTIKSTLGVDIYLNGVGDAQEQFNNLQLIIEEYQDSIHELEYIDLRFGNRVYVR